MFSTNITISGNQNFQRPMRRTPPENNSTDNPRSSSLSLTLISFPPPFLPHLLFPFFNDKKQRLPLSLSLSLSL